jgi:hypothetical protein
MPPISPQDFRERADACERLAKTAVLAETRETMLYLATRWLRLADEDEVRQKTTHSSATSPPPPSE